MCPVGYGMNQGQGQGHMCTSALEVFLKRYALYKSTCLLTLPVKPNLHRHLETRKAGPGTLL